MAWEHRFRISQISHSNMVKEKKKTTNPDTLLVHWWSLQSVGLSCYFGLWELGVCLYIPEESPTSHRNVRSHTEGATNSCDGAKDVPRQTGSGLQHPILSVAHNRPTVSYTSVRFGAFQELSIVTADQTAWSYAHFHVISQSQPSPAASLLQGTQ